MALGALGVASLVASGLKAGAGLIQGIGGARKQKQLWASRPQLGITAGETANDQLYNQLASATEMPGQRQFEDKLGQTYAEGVSDINKTAISSLGATQGAIDLSGKRMQAVQDLAGQFAEFKAQRQTALAGWNTQKTQLEQERFNVNEYQPWNVKMNEAVGQKQAGFQSFGSGLDSGLGILGDLSGTEQMMKMYQAMYGGSGEGGLVKGNRSKPLGFIGNVNLNPYNPQQNLDKTLSGMFSRIKPNWNY